MNSLNSHPRRDLRVLRRKFRRGFSLLELLAVITLLGILAGVGITRMNRGTLLDVGAQGDARRVALDLLQARRRAISTGDNHYVLFTMNGGSATGFTVYRRASGGDVAVESPRTVSDDVTITPNTSVAEFAFDGTSLASYTITVAGEAKSWTVQVIPATGSIRVQ